MGTDENPPETVSRLGSSKYLPLLAAAAFLLALPCARADEPIDAPAAARHVPMSSQAKPFQWRFHLDTEAVDDVAGGLRRGTASDSLFHAAFATDTEALGWWRGGRLMLSAAAIRSQLPSASYVGDLQGVSNIEAPDSTRLYQFWYRQTLSASGATLRGGLIDLNDYFAATGCAGILLNASFGLQPTITANAATSTYPKPGYGLVARFQPAGLGLSAGLFQGAPADRPSALHKGYMAIGEAGRRYALGGLKGRYKLGFWLHRQPGDGVAAQRTQGGYAIVEDDLRRNAGVFLQLGAAGGNGSVVQYYLGAGVSVRDLTPSRPRDRLALGVARAWIRDARAETTWELTYRAAVTRRLFLQPDLQYIVHPGGDARVGNALVATLRLHIEFY